MSPTNITSTGPWCHHIPPQRRMQPKIKAENWGYPAEEVCRSFCSFSLVDGQTKSLCVNSWMQQCSNFLNWWTSEFNLPLKVFLHYCWFILSCTPFQGVRQLLRVKGQLLLPCKFQVRVCVVVFESISTVYGSHGSKLMPDTLSIEHCL